MRPCDGTSGLVRGNRRKAVFAFERLLFQRNLSRFPEVRGKIGNRRAQPDFRQQNRRSRKRKTGVWSVDLGFLPHFRNRCTEVCGKFRNPRARRPFPSEKPQVEALRHLGVHGIFLICRILPVFASVADCVSLYSRLDNEQNSQFRLNTKTPAGAKLLLPALACLLVPFRLAQRPVLDPYASVGSTPSSLRTSSKAAAMALSMS